ncbi:complement component 1 Q subcomponent-binding protein, mitochondrial-like [Ornithodoros turicata]|uniref:Putative complement component 1 n=1 Tax=Ornithodoros turicata TaxID=34597 RepID=A0A2R5LIJ7_9ACAR
MAGNIIANVSRVLSRSSRYNSLLNVINVGKNELVTVKPLSSYASAARSRHLLKPSSTLKTVTCSCSQAITKGDKELAEFLLEEIDAEKKARKGSQLPKLEGFDVKADGAELTLTKKFNSETVTVRLNVNHSVDAEDAENFTPSSDKVPEAGEMKSKPSFNVEIEQNGKKLYFSCTFTEGGAPEDQSQDSYNDAFSVAEFAIYEGDWKDAVYTVSGDIMDGYLYDLLMNMLEERGISNEFADQLVEFCTTYEHGLYIELLEKLRAYVTQK